MVKSSIQLKRKESIFFLQIKIHTSSSTMVPVIVIIKLSGNWQLKLERDKLVSHTGNLQFQRKSSLNAVISCSTI